MVQEVWTNVPFSCPRNLVQNRNASRKLIQISGPVIRWVVLSDTLIRLKVQHSQKKKRSHSFSVLTLSTLKHMYIRPRQRQKTVVSHRRRVSLPSSLLSTCGSVWFLFGSETKSVRKRWHRKYSSNISDKAANWPVSVCVLADLRKKRRPTASELYNPWKDGCLSFGAEVIQITKYYRETPESRPIEKCKVQLPRSAATLFLFCSIMHLKQKKVTLISFQVQVNFQHIETIKNDNERLLLLISTPSEELIFQFQCLVRHSQKMGVTIHTPFLSEFERETTFFYFLQNMRTTSTRKVRLSVVALQLQLLPAQTVNLLLERVNLVAVNARLQLQIVQGRWLSPLHALMHVKVDARLIFTEWVRVGSSCVW